MTRRKIPKLQAGELPWATRVQLAIDEYKSTYTKRGWASFHAVGKQYNIAWTTIRDRVKREAISRKLKIQGRQRLTPAEEDKLQEYCLLLER